MSKKRRNLVDGRKYHYVYRITNIKEGMYYYGVHSCDCDPKEDIGIKYFSSSKKEFIKHQKQNPEEYKYKVIKIFASRVEANCHEEILHAKFDVKLHQRFYNKHNACSKFNSYGMGTYQDENGEKIFLSKYEAKSRNLKGYPKTDKHKANLRIPKSEELKKKIGDIHRGKIVSEDSKSKMRESKIGEKNNRYGTKHTEETKAKQSLASKGKPKSEEHKKKIKENANKTIICPHCSKEGQNRIMKRWHFDKCMSK